jgi:hypothetical protein
MNDLGRIGEDGRRQQPHGWPRGYPIRIGLAQSVTGIISTSAMVRNIGSGPWYPYIAVPEGPEKKGE